MGDVAAVILAAGMGTRMKSRLVKVLHRVCGRPMVEHTIRAVQAAGVERTILVVGHQAEAVMDEVEADVEYVVQEEQLGTGHAVMQAAKLLDNHRGTVVVTFGDTPLYRSETIANLIEKHERAQAAASMLSAVFEDPFGYGRIVRNAEGGFDHIVEEKDATPGERQIKEINTGTFCFSGPDLFAALRQVGTDNAQGEYYLTDVLGILQAQEKTVQAVPDVTFEEALGVNNRIQLAQAEKILRRRILDKLMTEGVTIVDPETTFVDDTVMIGADTIVYPFTFVEGDTVIGENCNIGPNTQVRDCRIGDDVVIDTSVVTGSGIEAGATIGPFAYVTSGTTVQSESRVGAFNIGPGSKTGGDNPAL